MRIAWQTEHYPDARKGGGSVTNTSYICHELRDLGHDVIVLAGADSLDATAIGVRPGDWLVRLSPPALPARLWPLWPLLEARALQARLSSIAAAFDAFVCHDPSYGLALKRLYPTRPVIFRIAGASRVHDACVEPTRLPGGPRTDLRRRLLAYLLAVENDLIDRRAWRRADALVVQSMFMKRDLSTLYGLTPERIHVNPSGVDVERFASAHLDSATLSVLGNADGQKHVITFCGRLVRMKNVSYLLRGFRAMRHRERCILAIVGDGDQRAGLEAEARELGIADLVRFVGHAPRVDEFLAASDVFVLPSVYEPFANALLEAMAAGLPCLALRPDFRMVRTSASEIIADTETGFLVDPKDPADLGRRLDLLVTRPSLRKELGQRAQTRCRELYTWRSCAASYLGLISRLVGQLDILAPDRSPVRAASNAP